MYFTWAFLATYCALYVPLALYLVRRLDRWTRLPLILTLPIVWTALEYLRVEFGTGFSWYLLGHSQHDFLPLIQIADLAGVYAVSFLVLAVNALLFEILYRHAWFRTRFISPLAIPRWSRLALLGQGLVVAGAVLAALAYGTWRLGQDTLTSGPRIALIQGNLDQRIRNLSMIRADAAEAVANHFIHLSDLAMHYRPDLIVWPETSYPGDWVEDAPGQPTEDSKETARRASQRWRTAVLIGMEGNVRAGEHRHRYNSAVLIGPQGQYAGRYDKIHRVPFGEYVPLRDWLPCMNQLAPYDFDYSVWPGQAFTRFGLQESVTGKKSTFGVLICYEDTDPDVTRPYGGSDGQPPADFLLNISNDGWFDGSSEHDQHLAICRFRAIECRRSVARAVNMGISALIDSNGRVLAPRALAWREEGPAALFSRMDYVTPDTQVWSMGEQLADAEPLPVSRWHEFKKVPGVLLATVPLDSRNSLYTCLGDWLPWSCWGLMLLGVFRLLPARLLS
jgi:apolipoprotein N-acyltransferase